MNRAIESMLGDEIRGAVDRREFWSLAGMIIGSHLTEALVRAGNDELNNRCKRHINMRLTIVSNSSDWMSMGNASPAAT